MALEVSLADCGTTANTHPADVQMHAKHWHCTASKLQKLQGANTGDGWVSIWKIRVLQHHFVPAAHHEAVERDPSFEDEGHHLHQRVRKQARKYTD